MVEINLVPDVKLELLKAQKMRRLITFISMVVGIASAVVVIALVIWVYPVQSSISSGTDKEIDEQFKTLTSNKDVNTILTLQDQLAKIDELGNNKVLVSRIYNVTNVILPEQTTISELTYTASGLSIAFDGQSRAGYQELEALQKIIERTEYAYPKEDKMDEYEDIRQITDESERNKKLLEFCKADAKVENEDDKNCVHGNLLDGVVTVSDTSYGRSSDGSLVLRFRIQFTVADEAFAVKSGYVQFIGPNKQNVTDSFTQIEGMFEEKASDCEADDEECR